MRAGEPVADTPSRRPKQHHEPGELGFQGVGICDKKEACEVGTFTGGNLDQEVSLSVMNDSTKTASGKANNDSQVLSPYERLHQAASLPDKATALLATFDAIAGIGCLPVALGPDSKGGIKKPTGGADWGLQPLDSRRQAFVKTVNSEDRNGTLDAMGVGLQPRGRLLVVDVDPPGKDRTKLDESLAELTELSGGECPSTFQVDGRGGCHLWFTVSDRLLNQWAKAGRGKTVIRLVCGGNLELFMPMDGTQYQVATAPSAGKTIACHIDPAPLPEPFEATLLAMLRQADTRATPTAPFIGDADQSWTAREKCFRAIIRQCDKAIRSAPQGSKHDAIRDRSLLLAGYAGGMGYTGMKAECTSVLIEAAMAVGSSEREARRVVGFGWINGIEKPLIPSDPKYLKIEQDFADRASRLAAERVKTGSLIESLASKAASLPIEDSQRAAMQAVTSQSPTSVAEVSPLQGANTDGGRGRMLGEFLDGKARHVHEWKENGWLWWDGCRWKRSTPTVHQAAKGWLPNAIAARFGDYKAAKEADAKKSITDALWWISTDPRILLGVNDIDANGWLFNCANGTMDLDAMKFRPADPEDRITKISPTAYDPDAKCPHFMGTLEYFVPDPAVREMIQTHAGSALTGIVTHLKLPILHGHGNNGKSTIIVAIMDTLGADYAVMLDAEVITATGQNGRADAMYHVADLHGKRLVVVNELEESATLKTSALKKLISSDPVKARRPYEMPFDFSPSYKAFMLTNHRPRLKTTDHGTMRRLAIVPFNVTIDPAKDVKNFNRTLRAETPGILNWLIEGCLKWKAAGMAINIPQAVAVATDSYATDEDQIGQFFAACVNKARGGFVTGQALFEAYRRWCESSGYDPATLTAFGRRAQQAYPSQRKESGRVYQGIVTRSELDY